MPDSLEIITKDDFLQRKLPLIPNFYIKETGMVTSAVFKLNSADKSTDKSISVNLERLVSDIHTTFDKNTHGLVKISAQVPIEMECDCIHTPQDDNIAHSSIFGINKKKSKKLSSSCSVIYPQYETY